MCITPSHAPNLIVYLKMRNARAIFLIFTCARVRVVCLGESRLSQVNNSPRANVFPAGVANFGKALYRPLERSTQDMDIFCTVPRTFFSWSRVDLARLLACMDRETFGDKLLITRCCQQFAPRCVLHKNLSDEIAATLYLENRFFCKLWTSATKRVIHPSSLSKSAGLVFLSGKASLVSISAAILWLRSWHVYFLLEFEFRGKSCVEWEHGGEDGISRRTQREYSSKTLNTVLLNVF